VPGWLGLWWVHGLALLLGWALLAGRRLHWPRPPARESAAGS
jgi:hypothetical protein